MTLTFDLIMEFLADPDATVLGWDPFRGAAAAHRQGNAAPGAGGGGVAGIGAAA